ncbi:MAG TPA: hypothetical protein VFW35_11740 [Sphingomicrobium sp.]|nr:hypothetical protein [Sphingomicrobium sp.]
MATVAGTFSFRERRPDQLSGTPRAHSIDRWIFVFMAAWFIAIVLTGFIPDALMKIGLVQSGQRPPFPIIMHVHAAAMGSFLLLLLAQSVLMATGRRELHMKVGIAAFAFVPVLVVVGMILAPTIYHQVWNMAHSAPAGVRQTLQQRLLDLENILLIQTRVGILFPLFMAIGLRARAGNSGLHKRMMFLATAVPLPAAIDRMTWLPNTLPASPFGSDLWILAALSPLFVWDVVRNRRVHEAYVIWLAVYVPVALVTYGLWDTPWWHATARQIMGV